MGPPGNATEPAVEAAELRESGLPLTDQTPSGAGEEPADAEAAGAPGRGRCWLCRSWSCASRAEPGECARGPGAGLTWGGRAGAGGRAERGLQPGCSAHHASVPTLPGEPSSCLSPEGAAKQKLPSPPSAHTGAWTGESF
jgi:hypothetical protein